MIKNINLVTTYVAFESSHSSLDASLDAFMGLFQIQKGLQRLDFHSVFPLCFSGEDISYRIPLAKLPRY